MRLPARLVLPAVSVLAALVVGCGSSGPGSSPSGSLSPSGSPVVTPSGAPSGSVAPTGSPGTTALPGGDIAVVRIEQTGGMLPPWMTLDHYPTVVLYADGRLITEGPQIELYPGPALPNLVVTVLTPEGVARVLEWAADAGLHGEDRFLGQLIPDAPVTTFTVVRGDDVHTTTVTDLSAADPEVAAVARFQEVLLAITEWLPTEVISDGEPYAWDRLQILAAAADPDDQPDPQLVTISEWPLQDLATVGIVVDEVGGRRCAVVQGAELDALRPALATANELTLWRSEDVTYSVQLHPLLPGDPPCPGLAGP